MHNERCNLFHTKIQKRDERIMLLMGKNITVFIMRRIKQNKTLHAKLITIPTGMSVYLEWDEAEEEFRRKNIKHY